MRKLFVLRMEYYPSLAINVDFLIPFISEGVLAKNLIREEGSGEDEECVYLAYERFEDHLTTSYLLDEHLDDDLLDSIFRNKGKLSSYIDDPRNQGILESLSVQIPERTGKELYELLNDEQKALPSVIESFVYSLI